MFHPGASAGAQVSLCCFRSQESVGFSCPCLRVPVASVSGSCTRSRVGSRQRLDPFLCPILSQAGENLFLELVSLFRSVLTHEPHAQPLGWRSHLPSSPWSPGLPTPPSVTLVIVLSTGWTNRPGGRAASKTRSVWEQLSNEGRADWSDSFFIYQRNGNPAGVLNTLYAGVAS